VKGARPRAACMRLSHPVHVSHARRACVSVTLCMCLTRGVYASQSPCACVSRAACMRLSHPVHVSHARRVCVLRGTCMCLSHTVRTIHGMLRALMWHACATCECQEAAMVPWQEFIGAGRQAWEPETIRRGPGQLSSHSAPMP
jgi:hypothetical protein